jgi:hypothetical protein
MNHKNTIRRLEAQWAAWLATSERLLKTLHEQTVALTLRDTERLARLQPEIDTMLEQMRQADEEAVACVYRLAEELGCEPRLRSLTHALDKAEAQSLQAVANQVVVAERHASQVIAKNRALVENELDHIGGTLALIAREASVPSNPYGDRTAPTHAVVMNAVA